VVFVLDASKSMMVGDVVPTRLDAARLEIHHILDHLQGGRAALVPFAGLAFVQTPLTTDTEVVKNYLDDLKVEDMPLGGTAIGRAIKQALEALTPADQLQRHGDEDTFEEAIKPFEGAKHKAIVLFTDGEDHEGDPVQAARDLAASGVKIFVVGIGSRTGEPIPTYSEDGTWTGYMRDRDGNVVTTSLTAENEVQLQEIAAATGGRYLRAENGGVGVDQVAAEIRTLQQGERESRRMTVHENRYALALLPGFLLLVLEALLPEAWLLRRRRRLALAANERKAGKA